MPYAPRKIFVDETVIDLPVTQRILKKFPHIRPEIVHDKKEIKLPQPHTAAKKQLYLSGSRGQNLKSCQGMGDYVCCQLFTMALVSDCHLECTYCILQDYLQNNPVITINTNVEEIFADIALRLRSEAKRLFRISTGELSDSLALDHITEFSRDYHSFVRSHENVVLELKTKTVCIDGLLLLAPHKRLVVSWSLNPQSYIEKEEHKCVSLEERFMSARRIADHGFPVGFHLDPLLCLDDWENEYKELTRRIGETFTASEIAWISIGSLRYTPGLKKIVEERFPKSRLMTAELYPSLDGKIRYFRPLREKMYKTVTGFIQKYTQKTPHYLCMETPTVWQHVYGGLPASNRELEGYLAQKFSDTTPTWSV